MHNMLSDTVFISVSVLYVYSRVMLVMFTAFIVSCHYLHINLTTFQLIAKTSSCINVLQFHIYYANAFDLKCIIFNLLHTCNSAMSIEQKRLKMRHFAGFCNRYFVRVLHFTCENGPSGSHQNVHRPM